MSASALLNRKRPPRLAGNRPTDCLSSIRVGGALFARHDPFFHTFWLRTPPGRHWHGAPHNTGQLPIFPGKLKDGLASLDGDIAVAAFWARFVIKHDGRRGTLLVIHSSLL